MKLHDYQQVQRLIIRALAKGAERTSTGIVKWDISGNCSNSFEQKFIGRPPANSGRDFTWKSGQTHTLELLLYTRCRKCENCLRKRATLWRERAKAMIALSERTWFGTLTLGPERQFKITCAAADRAQQKAITFSELSEHEQFKLRTNEISLEVTRWLKRVRKRSGARIKYCLVYEKHKSGDPHLHVLVHQLSAQPPVLHSQLSNTWTYGFTNFKLVTDDQAARYVSKYLSKSISSRVRASKSYGKIPDFFASRS